MIKELQARTYSGLLAFGLLLMLVFLVTSCAGTRDAYRSADGLWETGYVVSEHYAAVLRQAREIATNPLTSQSVKDQIKAVEAQTTPPALDLVNALEAYQSVENAETEAELQEALNKTAIALSRLIDLVKGVRR